MTFERIDLGQAGVPYVKERLSHNMSLSRLILATVDLNRGNTFTFFPQGAAVSREEMLEFNLDSDELGPVESAEHLRSVLHKFLAEDERRLCIFEDIFLKKDDLSLEETELPVLFYNSEVYYFLLSSEATLDSIGQLMMASGSLTDTVFVVSKISGEHPIHVGGDMTTAGLKAFAERAEAVVVEAYDGGGYLLWLSEQSAVFEKDGETPT